MSHRREDRWQHLCLIADQLKGVTPGDGALGEVSNLLESVLEVFSKDLDPTDDFEGYAVRQLIKAIYERV